MSEYLKLCKPKNPLSRLSSHAAPITAFAPVGEGGVGCHCLRLARVYSVALCRKRELYLNGRIK